MSPRAWVRAAVFCLATGAPLSAQDAAPLERVEDMARMGHTEEARVALLEWWGEGYAKASRRDVQRALWLRGRLTVDPGQAAVDYRRLVIEYPGGPFSDRALFRLAQAAFAAGDAAAAEAEVERLRAEYPGSPVRREAEAWLQAAGPVPAPAAGQPLTPVQEPVTAPEEPVVVTREAVAPVARPPEAAPVVQAADPSAPFSVQLGAFANRSRAEALRRRARDSGFEARLALVPGSDLIRVRVGRFDAQEDADAILGRLLELGFTAALAKDAHLEETVGR